MAKTIEEDKADEVDDPTSAPKPGRPGVVLDPDVDGVVLGSGIPLQLRIGGVAANQVMLHPL